jgi:hypothetical protein
VSVDLIDAFLPHYDVISRHALVIRASAARVYACLKTADMNASLAIRTLFTVRGHGSGAFSERAIGPRRSDRRPLTLDTLAQSCFVLLGERPADEIVLGLIARPWTPRYELRPFEASAFTSFAEPGFAKIVWSFKLDEADGIRLSTQTRVRCLDRASLMRFRLYWAFTGPFSGLVKRELLRLVRACAQRPQSLH